MDQRRKRTSPSGVSLASRIGERSNGGARWPDGPRNERRAGRMSNAASPGELPGLEAFLAEDRAPLRRPEGHRRFLAAGRASRDRFHPFARDRPPAGRLARLPLQALHRFGSFLKFLSAKNCCSPAVQMNSVPQSTHLRIRSWNSIGRYLVGSVAAPTPARAGASSGSACAPAPVWPGACHPASSRTNVS